MKGERTLDPLKLHKHLRGKTKIVTKERLTEENLPLLYTPGVGQISTEIARDKSLIREYTGVGNTVAIVTDGSAVLGLGNIGPEAALPVMEGKAAIFSDFSGVNAVPICLSTQDPEEIIKVVKYLAPSFGGINLEDIAAPACFEIEKRLSDELDIPVFHDDQHGTAIVVLAGLVNAIKITGKNKKLKVVISGAGAAGLAIAQLLMDYGINQICLCDSKGVITDCRNDINRYKQSVTSKSKAKCGGGACRNALQGADVLIGVSQPGQFTAEDVSMMAKDPIVFALANPTPEIMPEEAHRGGAAIVATGRSDYPNQLNNALVFPGLFRGILDHNVTRITQELKIAVSLAIADVVERPTKTEIIPSIFSPKIVPSITGAIARFSK